MYRGLRPKGVLVPNGFAVTADAYRHVLDQAGAWAPLRAALDGLDPRDVDDLARRRGRRAREIVLRGAAAGGPRGRDPRRASAPARGVRPRADGGRAQLRHRRGPARTSASPASTRRTSTSQATRLFSTRAGAASPACSPTARSATASTRASTTSRSSWSVGVMKMVRADLGASGVVFTLDTESGFRDVVLVTARLRARARTWCRARSTRTSSTSSNRRCARATGPCCAGSWGARRSAWSTRRTTGRDTTRNCRRPQDQRDRYCITDERGARLADDALAIEDHYSAAPGTARPWTSSGRRTVSMAASTSCRHGPRRSARSARGHRATECALDGQGRVRVDGPGGRRRHRRGRVHVICESRTWRTSSPARCWSPTPRARLGHGDEVGRRRRHQPWRAHLPRGHRRPRARHPGRGGLRARDVDAAHRRRGDRELRRGRLAARSTRAGLRSRRRAPTCRRWRVRART